MTMYSPVISVTAPVNWAIEHAKRMLFRPFDLGKWFVIGFCAWLAGLGESGGANFPSGGGGSPSDTAHNFREVTEQAGHFVADNLYWIVPLVLIAVVVGLAIGLVLVWLNSRGKFMFLYCVAFDQAEVKRPWQEFAREGNSLFWFRLVLGIVAGVVLLILVGGGILLVGPMLWHGQAEAAGILLAIVLGMVFLAVVFCFWLIGKFTADFVVPIMFLRRSGCTVAWQEFLGLLRANAGHFTLYVLFQIVLAMAIAILVLMAVCLTCCIAGCLLAIPYIGTVALLPVLVFERSYSLYYLAQFGPAYSVFPPAPPVPPANTLPS